MPYDSNCNVPYPHIYHIALRATYFHATLDSFQCMYALTHGSMVRYALPRGPTAASLASKAKCFLELAFVESRPVEA